MHRAYFATRARWKRLLSPIYPSHPLFILLDCIENLWVMLLSFWVSTWPNRFQKNMWMLIELEACLDQGILRCRSKASSLMARVPMANNLISNTVFTSAMLEGRPSFLDLKTKLICFIWSGSNDNTRHKVNVDTITKAKQQGG